MPIKRPKLSTPELTQFNELSNIADSFAKLSESPLTSIKEKLKVFLVNQEDAISKELMSIADSLDKLTEKGTFKGDKGDQGEQGLPGIAGKDGESIVGPQGLEGPQGIQGIAGKTGPQGQQGERGIAGLDGRDGKSGEPGVKGEKGDKGDKGDSGSPDTAEQILKKLKELKDDERFINNADLNRAINVLDSRTNFLIAKINNISAGAGATGPTGATGAQGSQGSVGSQGSQGSAGATGATGSDGARGATGPTGPGNASSGVYTPLRSAEANMDANVTMSEAQYMQVGSVVTVSGRFTANPALTATVTSFEIDLPVASNIGAAEDAAGVAFCGTIAAMGAEIIGVAANDTVKIFWVSSDIGNQTWSYIFNYTVI